MRRAALLAALLAAGCAGGTTWEPVATLQRFERKVPLTLAWDASLAPALALRGVQLRIDDTLVHDEGHDLSAHVGRGSWSGRVVRGVHRLALVYDVGPDRLTPWGYDLLYRVRTVRDVNVGDHARRVDFLLTSDGPFTQPLEERLRVAQRDSD